MGKAIKELKLRSKEIEDNKPEEVEADVYGWIVDLLISYWLENKKLKTAK
jgi:hypothetical protein